MFASLYLLPTFVFYLQIERWVNNVNVWRHHVKKHWMVGGFEKRFRSHTVCGTIGGSASSEKSSRSHTVCLAIGGSTGSEKSSRSLKVCGTIVGSEKSSRLHNLFKQRIRYCKGCFEWSIKLQRYEGWKEGRRGGWVTWFSRGTEEGSVSANRVLKGTIENWQPESVVVQCVALSTLRTTGACRILQSLWGDPVNFLVTQPKVFHQNFYLNEILGAEKTCQYNTFCRKLRKHQFELCWYGFRIFFL